MTGNAMEHRATDTSTVSVTVERKIPLTWVLGGTAGAVITLAIAFASWAWNISLTLNNVSRDVVLVGKTLEKVEASQKETASELAKGASRDAVAEGRVADLERRFNAFEAKQEARQAVRQQQP